MRKILLCALLSSVIFSNTLAKYMFQETDPYCSISGTTHNSFPGERSDTSSWNIPTVYQGECDTTPELSEMKKDAIFNSMEDFFQVKDMIGPVYGGGSYGGNDTLNPKGQKFVVELFFPAVIVYINNERNKINPDTKKIAILNYAVKTIGYDYFLNRAE